MCRDEAPPWKLPCAEEKGPPASEEESSTTRSPSRDLPTRGPISTGEPTFCTCQMPTPMPTKKEMPAAAVARNASGYP